MCDPGRGLFHALLCVVCFVEAQIAAGASRIEYLCARRRYMRHISEVLGGALHSQRCFSLLGGFVLASDPSLLRFPRPSFWSSRGRQQRPLAAGSEREYVTVSRISQNFVDARKVSGRGCRGHAPAHRRLHFSC